MMDLLQQINLKQFDLISFWNKCNAFGFNCTVRIKVALLEYSKQRNLLTNNEMLMVLKQMIWLNLKQF
jgi:hypothetical protein